MNPSLRTEESERNYLQASQDGYNVDISQLPASTFRQMKLLPNQFAYNAFHRENDMLLGLPEDNFMSWWIKVGMALEEGALPYHQFIYNIGDKQSQPQVPHGHVVNFYKSRKDNRL